MPERTCSVDGCCAPHRARGLCSTHYNQQHQPGRHRKATVACVVCGKSVIKARQSRYRPVCSMDCRWFLCFEGASCPIPQSHPAHPQWLDRLLPVLWVAGVPVPPKPKRWVAGSCHRCGKAYVAEDYTDTARFCSTTCLRRISKQRYRARKRQAYVANVSPRLIYERDGWRCQLCRKPVRRDHVAPAPLAPVIDHVVPLARGGTHEPANVQCAHFLCNSIKSDSMAPVLQLALM
jgi:endogenous inhibitor of DNA gyrase (YacG/DUF329 family)